MDMVNYAEKFDEARGEKVVEDLGSDDVSTKQEKEVIEGKVICNELLNLRAAPNGEVIGKLFKDTIIHIDIDRSDDEWVSITAPSGVSGYVMSKYIEY